MLAVDANGSVITPEIARQMMAQLTLKFGEVDDHEFWAEMHPSQAVEWEARGTLAQIIGPVNLEAKPQPFRRTFAGLPLEINEHLDPSVVLIRKNREIVAEIARLGLTNWHMEDAHAG
jgi:hypothetical protein